MLNGYLGTVFCMDARRLLASLPNHSIHSGLMDPMYGVRKTPYVYDACVDNFGGDPDKWWMFHEPIYQEIRRVLKPGGTFAWAMGMKFRDRFAEWFGGHRRWALSRFQHRGLNAFGHFWVVQTAEQEPIRFPDADGDIYCYETPRAIRRYHPCPKSAEEMRFLVEHLTHPGDIVLDVFCGTGTTLLAAEQLGRRWIGCDLSEKYCRVALWQMDRLRRGVVS